MAILNTYRLLFKNEKTNETKSYYCNASSIIKAIEYTQPNEDNEEPYQVSVIHKNTLTEFDGESIPCTLNVKFVNEIGEEIEDCGKSYPSTMNNIIRGSIIYINFIPYDNYEFVKWINYNDEEIEYNPMKLVVPTDESFVDLICKVVVKSI